MKTTVTPQEHSEVRIDVVLSWKDVEKYRDAVTKHALSHIEVDGFRKGKVPEDIAKKQLNQMAILEEMAHKAISDKYVDIVKDTKIKPIGYPQITITEIADGSDLEFSLLTTVVPEVTLGDYKKIVKEENKKEEETEVTEEEMNDAVMNLRKMRYQQVLSEEAKDRETVPSWNEIDEKDLPDMDDAWAQGLGAFESLEDFMTKMKENLAEEKKAKAVEKKRLAIVEAILASATIDVPKMMIDYEVDKMMHEFEYNIAMTGVPFDEYLKSINKTREDYKEAWKEQATKRAQTQLVLNKIAASEKLEPKDKEVDAEVAKIMEQYKDQEHIDEQSARSYVITILTNQKVFEFLENTK